MKKDRLLLAIAVVSSGCTDGPGDGATNATESLERTLRELVTTRGGTDGLSHFILPDSDDLDLIPQDPRNPVTSGKVDLGRLLFHETGIATEAEINARNVGTYSCASCHHALGGFQANVQQGIGEGGIGFGAAGERRKPDPSAPITALDVQPIRTPSAMNGAYQPLMLWNGQFGATDANIGTEERWIDGTPLAANRLGYEGLETQAIAGLSVHRMTVTSSFCSTLDMYRDLFDLAFHELPEAERYSEETAGLAIAAFERTVLANQAPFQLWLRGDSDAMTSSQKRGAIVFFGEGACVDCHSGPALNDTDFHALGMPNLRGPGVYAGSTAEVANQGRGGFTGNPQDRYKFKTPQLYNLVDSPFLGHGGTFRSVREVIEYKNIAQPANPEVPAEQLDARFVPLGLSEAQISDLVDFIEVALRDPDLLRYEPAGLPSGGCFPNNDASSRVHLGCFD